MNNVDLNIYEDGSLPALDIGRAIDQIPNEKKQEFLNLCCKKLSYGGKLQLQGVHLDSFCKDYLFSQQANLAAILQLNSVTPLQDIQQILQQNQLKISAVTINNGLYSVEAVK